MNDILTAALVQLAAGRAIVIVDDGDRENEGDLVMAAEFATEELMAFFLRHGSGIICAPLSAARAEELQLPAMVTENTDPHSTAFTVSTDHLDTGTGISANDRALTLRALADPDAAPTEFRRPGHVFPLRARAGGVLERRGHTEAALDVVRLAGLTEVAVITELLDDNGVPLTDLPLNDFVQAHGLLSISVEDVARHRRHQTRVVPTGSARIPLRGQIFTATCYRSADDGLEHLALTLGDLAAADVEPGGVLTRVHSECLTGDVFDSARCDCGAQLDRMIEVIAAEGTGVIVYLRGHEGRGIGLGDKLRAYALQESGVDTVDSNLQLGLPIDARDYSISAAILTDLGVRRVALVTNNPAKSNALSEYGLELVRQIGAGVFTTTDNVDYLRTKRDRMGHDLPGLPTAALSPQLG